MKFPADAPVTDRKKDDLRERIERLRVDLGEVDEQFVRARGPGGQKVNKTSSAVVLRYPALSLTVKWSRERSRALNRFLALRELVDEIEERVSPETSERLKERARIRERKRRRRRRRKNG
ncbi:MAG: peptide chain release factor family protein [Planctomycetota bacterium]|jgi:protein subunit release factor B